MKMKIDGRGITSQAGGEQVGGRQTILLGKRLLHFHCITWRNSSGYPRVLREKQLACGSAASSLRTGRMMTEGVNIIGCLLACC
jgi:hypothetical protein